MGIFDAVIDKSGETCSILYNSCYGGFSYRKEAIDEYNLRKKQNDPHAEPLSYYSETRNDPLMIQLFHEYGSQWMSGNYATIQLATFPSQFYNSLEYHEYDGRENFTVNYQQYVLRSIKDLLAKRETTLEDIRSLYEKYASEIEKKF